MAAAVAAAGGDGDDGDGYDVQVSWLVYDTLHSFQASNKAPDDVRTRY